MRRQCPRCGYVKKFYPISVSHGDGVAYRCARCKLDHTDRSVTNFKHGKLSQEKHDVMRAMIKYNPKIPGRLLSEVADVTYKTAWLFKRRILYGPEAVFGYSQGGGRVGGRKPRSKAATTKATPRVIISNRPPSM